MDRKVFYAMLRRRDSGLFGTSLSQSQVDGIEGILDAFATHGDGNPKTLAYALATTYHETMRKMVPVREGFATTDAGARRAVLNLAKKRGPSSAVAKYSQPAGPYGHVYYGRGRVQETWLDNYRESSKDAGVDLVKYPDKHLDPEIDARILIRGLIDGRWNGSGKGIGFYLPKDGKDDVKNARRTVNVLDKWSTIAGYYEDFMKVIKAAGGVPYEEAKRQRPQDPLEKAMEDALQDAQDAQERHDRESSAPTPPSAPRGKSDGKSVNPLVAAAVAIFGAIAIWSAGVLDLIWEFLKGLF